MGRAPTPPSDTTHWVSSQLISLLEAILPPGVVVEIDGPGMHDPRSSTALHQLAAIGPSEPRPPRWRSSMTRLDTEGRISLPPDALTALGLVTGARSVARGTCNRIALVMSDAGAASLGIDARGRVLAPVWLRRAAGRSGSLLVGTRLEDRLVVVAPTGMLDGLGDLMVGGAR